MKTDKQKLKSVLEAVLFASGEPLDIEKTAKTLLVDKESIENCLSEMMEEYKNDMSSKMDSFKSGFSSNMPNINGMSNMPNFSSINVPSLSSGFKMPKI
jgi:chromosome segregation and condensation protein ScpB